MQTFFRNRAKVFFINTLDVISVTITLKSKLSLWCVRFNGSADGLFINQTVASEMVHTEAHAAWTSQQTWQTSFTGRYAKRVARKKKMHLLNSGVIIVVGTIFTHISQLPSRATEGFHIDFWNTVKWDSFNTVAEVAMDILSYKYDYASSSWRNVPTGTTQRLLLNLHSY